jgi:hypothetical protein
MPKPKQTMKDISSGGKVVQKSNVPETEQEMNRVQAKGDVEQEVKAVNKPELKADGGKEKDRLSRFKEWCQANRWIAMLLIIGTIVIAIGEFTDAIEKIQHFFSRFAPPVPPARPWREVRNRAMSAMAVLDKEGLTSKAGFYTNFWGAAFNLQSSIQGDLLIDQFKEEQKLKIGKMTESERKEMLGKQVDLVNNWAPYKALFTTEAAFRLPHYTQLSLELSEMKDALEELGRHPEFPNSQRSLYTSSFETIRKMSRTCDLVVAAMGDTDKRDLKLRLQELKDNSVPLGGELGVYALQQYLSSL